ncbi:conserved hypothetical protein [metagenome]|uniref:Uncharacterized protein n=1 Tax=metagenome TaxID=256318 RepID=A0A2P2CK80_9ZZZZ
MTDSPGLTPEHDAVRRLLADARHDGPTPPEVVARLDETLAALVAERSVAVEGSEDSQATEDSKVSEAPRAPVVDLAARRRRLVGTGVLAAAAVVVAGVALGQVLPGGQGSDDAGSSAGGADRSTSSLAEDDAGAQADGEAGGSSSQEMAPQSKSASPAPLATVPTLSSTDPELAEQVEALRATPSSARAERRQTTDLMRTCALPDLGRGRRLAAQVDGRPGLVLFQPVTDASQGVAIYVCGTPEPVRTLTLPAP